MPHINTESLSEHAKVGKAYSAQLLTTGGTEPFQWSISSGALPEGLTLTNQGLISGTPMGLGGKYPLTVKVTDENSFTATRQLTLTVDGPNSVPSITTVSLPSDTVGQSCEQTFGVTGGSAPYAWSVTKGTLPPGLSLNVQTGVVSGTPSQCDVYKITIQVTDGNGNAAMQTIPIDIIQPDEREIVWNGEIQNVPAFVGNDGRIQTTYIPIWYVMQLLESMGIESGWNGQHWNLTTSMPDLSNIQVGTGNTSIYLNGTLVHRVNTLAAADPWTNQPTTYMPIWYVEQILHRIGLQSSWNGETWTVTQQSK